MKRKAPLILTVFSGHRASKTFQLPPEWVTRLGALLCVMIAITLTASGLAFRFYRMTTQLDPSRIKELEFQLSNMTQKAEQAKHAEVPTPAVSASASASVPPEEAPPEHIGKPLTSLNLEQGLFSGLPLGIKRPQDSSQVPIEIGDLKSEWSGKILNVYFNIRYVLKNGSNQQGRIVILARGPESMLAYPSGVLNPPGSASLISPEKGEYFSVSRFREVRAKFGPVQSKDAIHTVETLIFGGQDQLLFHQIIKTNTPSAPAAAAAPETPAAPKPLAVPSSVPLEKTEP